MRLQSTPSRPPPPPVLLPLHGPTRSLRSRRAPKARSTFGMARRTRLPPRLPSLLCGRKPGVILRNGLLHGQRSILRMKFARLARPSRAAVHHMSSRPRARPLALSPRHIPEHQILAMGLLCPRRRLAGHLYRHIKMVLAQMHTAMLTAMATRHTRL